METMWPRFKIIQNYVERYKIPFILSYPNSYMVEVQKSTKCGVSSGFNIKIDCVFARINLLLRKYAPPTTPDATKVFFCMTTFVQMSRRLSKAIWKVLPHPAYSPDIVPFDYHLFRSISSLSSTSHQIKTPKCGCIRG